LSAVQGLRLSEVGEVLVVSEDLNWEGGTMKIMSKGLESVDYGEEFAVIDVVVSFCLRERLGKVRAGVPIAIGVGLEENSSRCRFRGVGGDGEGCGEVREMENGFRQEKGFKGVKGSLTSGSPVPLKVLFGEVDEGTGDIGVVGDESTVEVGEAKERVYIFDFCGGWPFGNPIEFDGVHGELTRFDDHSEVFYLVGGEFTLLKLEM